MLLINLRLLRPLSLTSQARCLSSKGQPTPASCLFWWVSVSVAPSNRDDTVRCAPAYVGEMATIDPSARRFATVRAKEPTVVARVAEPDFSRIANAHPFVWRHLAIELGDRLRQRAAKVPLRRDSARVFIASSSEGLKLARALKAALATDPFDVHVWIDGIFTPRLTNIEALEEELDRADFAVLLLSSDDRVLSRWVFSRAPRDNLILELGLFVGAIGRRRAIMVRPRGPQPDGPLGRNSDQLRGS